MGHTRASGFVVSKYTEVSMGTAFLLLMQQHELQLLLVVGRRVSKVTFKQNCSLGKAT